MCIRDREKAKSFILHVALKKGAKAGAMGLAAVMATNGVRAALEFLGSHGVGLSVQLDPDALQASIFTGSMAVLEFCRNLLKRKLPGLFGRF